MFRRLWSEDFEVVSCAKSWADEAKPNWIHDAFLDCISAGIRSVRATNNSVELRLVPSPTAGAGSGAVCIVRARRARPLPSSSFRNVRGVLRQSRCRPEMPGCHIRAAGRTRRRLELSIHARDTTRRVRARCGRVLRRSRVARSALHRPFCQALVRCGARSVVASARVGTRSVVVLAACAVLARSTASRSRCLCDALPGCAVCVRQAVSIVGVCRVLVKSVDRRSFIIASNAARSLSMPTCSAEIDFRSGGIVVAVSSDAFRRETVGG